MNDIRIQIEDLQTYFHNIELKAPGYRKVRFHRMLSIVWSALGVGLIGFSITVNSEFNPLGQGFGFVDYFNENFGFLKVVAIVLIVLGWTQYSDLTKFQNAHKDETKNYLIRAKMTGAPKPLVMVFNADGVRTSSTFGFSELQWAYFTHFEIHKGMAFLYHTYGSFHPDISVPLNLLTQEEINQLTELLAKNLKPRNK